MKLLLSIWNPDIIYLYFIQSTLHESNFTILVKYLIRITNILGVQKYLNNFTLVAGLAGGISASLEYILRLQASNEWFGSLSSHLLRSMCTPSVGLRVARTSRVLSLLQKLFSQSRCRVQSMQYIQRKKTKKCTNGPKHLTQKNLTIFGTEKNNVETIKLRLFLILGNNTYWAE